MAYVPAPRHSGERTIVEPTYTVGLADAGALLRFARGCTVFLPPNVHPRRRPMRVTFVQAGREPVRLSRGLPERPRYAVNYFDMPDYCKPETAGQGYAIEALLLAPSLWLVMYGAPGLEAVIKAGVFTGDAQNLPGPGTR